MGTGKRRVHRAKTLVPESITIEEKYARRRRGGRPAGKRMGVVARLERAVRAGVNELRLNGDDIEELVALIGTSAISDTIQDVEEQLGMCISVLQGMRKGVLGRSDGKSSKVTVPELEVPARPTAVLGRR
jgi:hypothetical protein